MVCVLKVVTIPLYISWLCTLSINVIKFRLFSHPIADPDSGQRLGAASDNSTGKFPKMSGIL